MKSTTWWQSRQFENGHSIFKFSKRKQASVESPLRIPVLKSNPLDIGILPLLVVNPEPTSFLETGFSFHPDSGTLVNLAQTFSIGESGRPTVQGTTGKQPSIGPIGNQRETDSANSEPSLANRLRILLAAPLYALLPGSGATLEWVGELMPFQQDGVRILIDSHRLLLADQMGLGKTVQVIAAVRILVHRSEIEKVLVVAPATLLAQWREELSKWAPELRVIIIRGQPTDRAWQWRAEVHVALVGYETLLMDSEARGPLEGKVWDLIVADEVQKIKNRTAAISVALKRVQRKRSWGVSGTPIENDERDLASILEFVDHEEFTSSRRYEPGPELYRRHRDLQLRRKKADVYKNLPLKQVTKIKIPLTARQQKSYDKAESEGIVFLRELGAEVQVQHVLALITRLKQICNADPETGESSKLNDIHERLSSLVEQGHRALIFSTKIVRYRVLA